MVTGGAGKTFSCQRFNEGCWLACRRTRLLCRVDTTAKPDVEDGRSDCGGCRSDSSSSNSVVPLWSGGQSRVELVQHQVSRQRVGGSACAR